MYDLILIEEEDIHVEHGVSEIPGIVCINRQIFDEARGVYIDGNQFVAICKDADIRPILRFIGAL